MSRIGYAIIALLIIGLGIYTFRPTAAKASDQWVKVLAIKPPADYQVMANGLHQRVSGKTVTIGELKLPLADQVAGTLWNQWTVLSASADKVVKGIPASSFAAHDYGIDSAKRRLWGEGFDVSWGSADGSGYVADLLAGTVYAVGTADVVQQLDRIAGRLDPGNPLPPGATVQAAEIAGTRLILTNGVWQAVGAPMRGNFRRRINEIVRLAGYIRLFDLAGTLPEGATPVTSLRLELDSEKSALAGLPAIYELRLFRTATGGALAVNALPVQAMSPADLEVWRAAIAALGEDRLFDLGDAMTPNPVERVVVEKAGREWFRLESTSGKDLDDFSSRWDVAWSGGREFADPAAAQRLVDALNDLTVRDVRSRLALEEDWPDAVRIVLLGKSIRTPFLELRGRAVRTATHVGMATRIDDLLERLAPDRFLDTMIAGRSPERVMKIQRRFLDRQPAMEEVLLRDSRGGWSRTWPRSEPVDAMAVQRIARVIATSRALSARLAGPDDRAIAEAPAFEIAVRFGPKPAGKANDFTELEDTTTNDLGLAIAKGADGRWHAIGIGTGTAYDLDDELVEQLRQGVADPLVLPLVPALVRRVQLAAEGAVVGLARVGEAWQVVQGDAIAAAADAVEVRRLLRDLAALTASRRGPGGALAANEIALTVSLELPGFDRETERLSLQIGKPGVAGAGPGEVALFAESTRPGAMESGRAFASAAAVAGFTVEAARFRAAAATP